MVAESVLRALDLDRAVDLVQEVCRIPSILGEEGPLAAFLASVMRASSFDDVELQPVVEDRPNAVGHVSLGKARRWSSRVTWTRSRCRTGGA